MQIRDFIASLEQMNFSLTVKDGKLILKGDSKKLSKQELEAIKTNNEVIDYIKGHKDELIEYISLFPGAAVAKNSKDIISVYRLSGLQQGMLFHGLYDNLGSYVEQVACDLIGPDIDLLLASWARLIQRHTILRSAFYYDSFSIPVQCVYREAELPVEQLDYRGLDAGAQTSALKEYQAADHTKGFDFKSAPLMRLAIIQSSDDLYRMIWTSHHILFDGWSVPILMEEFLNTYELLTAGKSLPELEEDRYEDYIRYLERRDKAAEEQYWRNYLQGITHGTLLPFVTASSERNKGIGHYEALLLILDKTKTSHIQQYAQSRRITVNTLMQGIWAWLLHKYTGDPAVVYGAVVSGRPAELPGVEQRVGMYINTLTLKAQVEDEKDVVSWLQGLQADQVSSRQYQYSALQDVQGWTGIKGDLFDSLLIFENYPVGKMVEAGTWSLRVKNLEVSEQTNYPLTVIVGISDELSISFNYNTELLEQSYVSEIRNQFEQVLHQVTNGSADKLGDLNVLTQSQEHLLLNKFNDTSAPYQKDKNVVELFEEQVVAAPDAIALAFETSTLTYNELNKRSNQLARYLIKNGVKMETLVPICLERGLDMLVGIWGILKAGGAYVPIDPDYPADRINYMLTDTGARFGLSTMENGDKLQDSNIPMISIDGDWDMIAKEPSDNLDIKILPSHLAYVIYTSGSTGKPKGVMIEHGGVVNLAASQAEALRLKPGMRSLQFASFGFDASCYEIFNTLLSGGSLVLSSKEDLLSAERFTELVKSHKVELAVLPPSFQLTLDDSILGILTTIVSAGEALNETTGLHLQSKGVRLINAYGPTETTVCASLSDDPIKADHIITIGKPIANAQIYILNTENELTPIGVTGEICVGGAGLARGYLNRLELTAEKFINNPFGDNSASRLYKTGDLGRWLSDGNIEYQGRVDDQVKIRGYRIELGEIESVLNQSGLVSQGAILGREDSNGNKRLIGYVVADQFDKKETQEYLATRLPEYMIPDLWIELESMPLSSSGKIDRKALPDPEDLLSKKIHVAPSSDMEVKLAEIWLEILEIDEISITDDFFELGGHSLLAIRLVSAVRKTFGMELPINDVFEYPTISLLAKRLTKDTSTDVLPAVKAEPNRPEHIPLSFSQERLWFIDQMEGSLQYHLPAILRLKGKVNKEVLEKTIRAIINRHEVLRTVILKDNHGQGYQQINTADKWSLKLSEPVESDEAGLPNQVAELIGKPFDLSADYMLRADLIKIKIDEHLLVVTMHHIASDGWSTSILVKEVVELYQSYISGTESKLPVLPLQYADYAIWQRTYMQGEVLDNKLKYWKKKLNDIAPLQLPTDHNRPVIQSANGATYSFSIGKELSDELHKLSRASGATLYMTMLAAFKVLLSRYSGQEDICVGTAVAGRNQQDLEGLIGFFINTLALRSNVAGDLKFSTLLEDVKVTTLEAYAHQEVPFERVVDAVVKTRDLSRSPLFQVMFSLQNTPDVPELKLADLLLSAENIEDTTAKFDLTFMMSEGASGIQGTVEYNTDLYVSDTIERMAGHYLNLLKSVVTAPDNQVAKLEITTRAEERVLLKEFNNTSSAYPKDKNIVKLIREHLTLSTKSAAIALGEKQLSYKDLDERSNQLANYLIKQGVKPNALVPICMGRSLEMIVGLLGILKAGAAYVPVDPGYPADRISYMLDDTGAAVVLSNTLNKGLLKDTIPVITLDADWEVIADEEKSDPGIVINPSDLAYVIYTSGSTGQPKGVMIEHQSLVNLVTWHIKQYEVGATNRATAMAGVGFDAFGWEIWPYLAAGASIYVIDDETRLSGAALATLFVEKKITHSFVSTALVPDFMELSRNKIGALKYLLTGGDKLSALNLEGIGYTVVNNYGPTENTVVATCCNVTFENKTPSIGKPISNTQVYIVNGDNKLSPIGVPGEICIGGAGLARGYHNRPELTAEKFVKDPFSEEAGARLYKTGDLGRWLADGNIEYLGRIDDQVKIRGYRIELGEIESVLNQSGLVSQALVLAKDDGTGNRRLVSYVVSPNTFDKTAAQAYLATKLPEYMVPRLWVELESIPLTPNGKIDRKALPDPELTDVSTEYVAPRNETEAKLALIWQELLGVERIGVYDNFFEMGGHSLLAMRLVSYIERDLLITIPIQRLFQFSSISDLSKYIEIQNSGNFQQENAGLFKLLDV